MKKSQFPELNSSPVSCGSWVINTPNGLRETFDRQTALKAHNAGLGVKTAYQHLVSLNQTHENPIPNP